MFLCLRVTIAPFDFAVAVDMQWGWGWGLQHLPAKGALHGVQSHLPCQLLVLFVSSALKVVWDVLALILLAVVMQAVCSVRDIPLAGN